MVADVVVLLALVLGHRGNLVRHSDYWIVGAASRADVAKQRLLPVVGGEDGDLVGGVADEAHVHVHGHHVLGFGQVLVEEGTGLALAHGVKVRHVDQLVVVAESGVSYLY